MTAVCDAQFFALVLDGVTYTSIAAGGDGYEPVRTSRKEKKQVVAAAETEEEQQLRIALEEASSKFESMKTPAKTTQERTRLIQASMMGEKDKVKSLVKKDAETIDAGDKRGFTAYHHACANGHEDVVKVLLKAGCNSAMLNDGRRTGWDLAKEMGRANVTDLLNKLAAKGSKKLRAEARVKNLEQQSEDLVGVAQVIG
eukprot:COSAG02_NODE_1654_length_11481_cov_3.465033_6_plen_199_part_00